MSDIFQDNQFEIVYLKNYRRLFSLAFRTTRSIEDAEDLVEEAYVVLLTRGTSLDCAYAYAFLSTTMRNLLGNYIRSDRKEQLLSWETLGEDFMDSRSTRHLRELLPTKLGKEEREILLLRYEEQLTHPEIAQRLGIPEGTSRSRAMRALNHTRSILKKEKV